MDLKGTPIAVTGATGFLGRYIVDALLTRGAKVVGVVRNPDRVPELKTRGVELRRADLSDRAALSDAFRGAAAVVANAALFALANRDWEQHLRTNILGTTNVLEAAGAAGVRRVVHISSTAVYAGRAKGRVIDEEWPQLSDKTRRTFANAYPLSKALSEQEAWRAAARLGLDLTALRPCAIYGAFDPNFTRLIRRLLSVPIVTVLPALRLPLVYAGDVAEGVAHALEKPVAIGRAYNLTGEDGSLSEFTRAWAAAGGRAPRFTLPVPLPFGASYDHSRATRELGWRNRPYLDALRETFAREDAARGGH